MTDDGLSKFIGNIIPKPKLHIYVSESIEVGYSQYGPTLNLDGVLTASSKVILIDDIVIQIKHEKQEEVHSFGWLAFLPHEFDLKHMRDFEFQTPSKFMVPPKKPYEFNILFADQEHYAEMNPSIKRIKTAWLALFQNAQPEQNINYSELFKKFQTSSDARNNVQKLKDLCFWTEGKYTLFMTISSKKINHTYDIQRTFTLSQHDVDCLRKNADIILEDLCKLPDTKYFYTKQNLSKTPSKK